MSRTSRTTSLSCSKGGVASDYEDLGQLGQDEPAAMRVEPSNGSNVILRRARPGLPGLGPHIGGVKSLRSTPTWGLSHDRVKPLVVRFFLHVIQSCWLRKPHSSSAPVGLTDHCQVGVLVFTVHIRQCWCETSPGSPDCVQLTFWASQYTSVKTGARLVWARRSSMPVSRLRRGWRFRPLLRMWVSGLSGHPRMQSYEASSVDTHGDSLIRKRLALGPYSRLMPLTLRWSLGGAALSCGRGTPVAFRADAAEIIKEREVGILRMKR